MDEAQRQQLIAYRRRWEAVAEVERAEAVQRTIQQNWLRLNYLYGFATALGIEIVNEEQDEETLRRWAILRRKT